MRDFTKDEAMRYWTPKKEDHIELDIIEHPDKYSDYIGSFKKDGEWSRMIWDGKEVLIQSRTISKKTGKYAEKQESLPHLVDEFKKLPVNTVILGEICYDELYLRSKDVGTILRCLPEKAIERQQEEKNKLHFYCFDILCFNDIDLSNLGFEQRVSYLNEVKNILGDKYIRYADIKTVDQIANEYQDYLNQGGEGFVLQKKDCIYEPGKRTAWQTIKLKKSTEEIELQVVGIIDPVREYTGKELDTWQYFDIDGTPITKYYYLGWKTGVIVNHNGTQVRVASGCTDADGEWLATEEAQQAIKDEILYAKVEAMEFEPDSGSMRHPRLVELRLDR